MAQYYTLDEAAKILRTTPDKVREMVRQGKLRGFQDKGTLRFRAHEVEELARAMGLGSDSELVLGDAEPEKKKSGSSSGRRKQPTPTVEDDKKPGTGRKPTMVKPPVGSDSDVRLVVEDFNLDEGDETPASSSSSSRSGDKKKPAQPDSGLRLLPMEEDSDVKLVPEDDDPASSASSSGSSRSDRKNTSSKRPSDSDIRIDPEPDSDESYDPLVTEEIDLDAEQMRQEEKPRKKSELKQPQKKKSELKQPQKSSRKLPTSSPFELSEEDIQLADDPAVSPGASGRKSDSGKKKGDSGKKKSAPVNLSLDDDSDDVELGLEPLDAGQSGVNLSDPHDSGPTLEDSSAGDDDGSSDMELSLDASSSSSSKKSASGKKKSVDEDSSSEFELTLDEGDEKEGSSEFELTLDDEPSLSEDEGSSSEFELTLDEDDGGVDLAPIDDSDEKDIFETNLDVPALDDESASEAMPLESEEVGDESSEFELDLDEGGEGDEEETGSQVVPLDDDDAVDEAAETARATARRRARRDEGDEDADYEEEGREPADEEDYETDEDEDEDEDERPAAAAAGTQPWGVFPALMLLPTVIALFVVGLMTFEMVRSMWGYHKGTKVSELVVRPLAEAINGEKLP